MTSTLSAKQAAIPRIAAATATSDMPALRTALVRGLDASLNVGLSLEQLKQVGQLRRSAGNEGAAARADAAIESVTPARQH